LRKWRRRPQASTLHRQPRPSSAVQSRPTPPTATAVATRCSVRVLATCARAAGPPAAAA